MITSIKPDRYERLGRSGYDSRTDRYHLTQGCPGLDFSDLKADRPANDEMPSTAAVTRLVAA